MLSSLLRTLRNPRERAEEGALLLRLARQSGLTHSLPARGLARFAADLLRDGFGTHQLIAFHSRVRGEQPAIADDHHRMSYRDLAREVERWRTGLAELGIEAGDRVAIMVPNQLAHVALQFAVPSVGAGLVEIGTGLKAREIDYILAHASPRAIIYHQRYADEIATAMDGPTQVLAVAIADDGSAHWPAVKAAGTRPRRAAAGSIISYTSGTTGTPKGADRGLGETSFSAVLDFMLQVDMRSSDRQLVVCPLYHSAPPALLGMGLSLGGSAVLMRSFDAMDVLETVARERITGAFLVPTLVDRLVRARRGPARHLDLSSLRWICCGAAPLSTATALAFTDLFGPILWNFYGATEVGLVTLAKPGDHAKKPGTVGRPLAGNELRICRDGLRLPEGEIGEIFVKNGMLIRGYYKDPDATAAAERDGFFSVGDLGSVDRDGYLTLAGRAHDLIISGGVNIYPAEIENTLRNHPQVADVAVIGVPDDEWGEAVRAVVVAKHPGALAEDDVIAYCREHLAHFKRPRSVVFLEELPRTATGKVLKRDLRSV